MLLLAGISGSAAASRAIDGEFPGEITATGPVTFTSALLTVVSLITLRGSIHRSILKVTGSLVGTVTDCRSSLGTAVGLGISVAIGCALSLPWHLRYVGYIGTLPRILSVEIEILNIGFLLRDLPFGGTVFNCLYQGNIRATFTENPGDRIRLSEASSIPTTTPRGAGCAENPSGTVRGTGILERRHGYRLL
ncbi:MAG: hypothetical protein WBC33_08050 [Conexibacter sp.]